MAVYGKTYWGKKWLEAFNGIDMDNRLPRGRTYANKGLVTSIDIRENHIKATVEGSWLYDVEITLKAFNTNDQQIIYDKVLFDVRKKHPTNDPERAELVSKKTSITIREKFNKCDF